MYLRLKLEDRVQLQLSSIYMTEIILPVLIIYALKVVQVKYLNFLSMSINLKTIIIMMESLSMIHRVNNHKALFNIKMFNKMEYSLKGKARLGALLEVKLQVLSPLWTLIIILRIVKD
jgi:hypothetical protein